MLNKWLKLKEENMRWEDVAWKKIKILEEVLEELVAVKKRTMSLWSIRLAS